MRRHVKLAPPSPAPAGHGLDMLPSIRGLLSSTSQLNLSRFGHTSPYARV